MTKVKLWREKPVKSPGKTDANIIFPSGRYAISEALRILGLGRSHRIAYPEFSSLCVINAIGRYCSPIPMKEVLENNLKVDAVLLYEQWGCPILPEVLDKVKSRFKDTHIILDMVDSAHVSLSGEIVVTSLAKLLGVSGGGLLGFKGEWRTFIPEKGEGDVVAGFDIHEEPYFNKVKHDVKTYAALDPHTKKWLSENDVFAAIEEERKARQKNLKTLFQSDWPAWMKKVVENGARPGIVPFHREKSLAFLQKKQEEAKKEGIETAIYHFNWSGDPVNPKYEKCLACPVHGMIE